MFEIAMPAMLLSGGYTHVSYEHLRNLVHPAFMIPKQKPTAAPITALETVFPEQISPGRLASNESQRTRTLPRPIILHAKMAWKCLENASIKNGNPLVKLSLKISQLMRISYLRPLGWSMMIVAEMRCLENRGSRSLHRARMEQKMTPVGLRKPGHATFALPHDAEIHEKNHRVASASSQSPRKFTNRQTHQYSRVLDSECIWLVVSTNLKNMKVNWDDYSQYMGE